MANAIMIMGKSGSGKSTSIKNLDPKETVIINVLKKKLPFKGSNASYNAENKNLFQISEYNNIIRYIESISANAAYIKNVVIDDMCYTMRKEYFQTAKQSGFQKYTEMAAHFQSIIQCIENAREEMNVFLMMHCDEVVSDNNIVGYKASTVGKLIDNSYNPIEVVPVLLFSKIKYDEKGKPQYGFYTHACVEGTVEIPAKSPEGMFEEDFIPNDLKYVIDKMNEYYN